jgi:magnesium transporter
VGEVTLGDWWRICRKEFATGLVLGLCLGVMGAARVVLWYHLGWHDYAGHPYRMAGAIWLSLAGVVTFGSTVGSMLPLLMHRLGFDPASASAPFVATPVDVTGLLIYFAAVIAFLNGTVL